MKQPYGFLCAVCLAAGAAASAEAATLTVSSGGSLQAALNAAKPGDTIVLQAGATFTGNYVLPVKTGTSYITVRSSLLAPGAGVRVTPTSAAPLAKIKAAGTLPAIRTAAGAHHWRLQLLEIIGNDAGVGEVVRLGTGAETTTSSHPRLITIERAYIHGHPTRGAKRGVALNSGNTTIRDSWVSDIQLVGAETQAIAGWNGTGPYRIENNHLSAAGVNLMFGGSDPKIANLVPSDITIRRNRFTKNLKWRTATSRPVVKNLLQLKNARRVVIEGNRFEYSWAQDQKGYAMMLTPWNNGAAPWTAVHDIDVRFNRFDHVGGGIVITGRHSAGSATTARVVIENNLLTDVSKANWGGSGAFIVSGSGATDVVVDHNTIIHDGPVVNGNGSGNVRFVYTNNMSRHNTYGIYGDGYGAGFQSINIYFKGAVIRRNVLAGGTASKYPADNFFPPTAEFLGNFVNPSGGNYRLGVSPYNNAGTDGKDIGADIDAIEAASR